MGWDGTFVTVVSPNQSWSTYEVDQHWQFSYQPLIGWKGLLRIMRISKYSANFDQIRLLINKECAPTKSAQVDQSRMLSILPMKVVIRNMIGIPLSVLKTPLASTLFTRTGIISENPPRANLIYAIREAKPEGR